MRRIFFAVGVLVSFSFIHWSHGDEDTPEVKECRESFKKIPKGQRPYRTISDNCMDALSVEKRKEVREKFKDCEKQYPSLSDPSAADVCKALASYYAAVGSMPGSGGSSSQSSSSSSSSGGSAVSEGGGGGGMNGGGR